MKNKKYDITIYILAMLFVIFSGMAARMISPFFDFSGYGAMRKFYDELFTAIIWTIEIAVMYKIFSKKFNYNIFSSEAALRSELPVKRLLFNGVIIALCIVIISAQIGFQVKPFYDFGEKFNGYDAYNTIGVFIRNAVKCVWIVIMAKAAQNLVETFMKKEKVIVPICGIILALTFGLYDLLTGMNNLPVTYALLYVVYGWLYLLVEKNSIKAYLLIVFIFLF